jgi:AbrB family looped-hinge helix DNA binding protein
MTKERDLLTPITVRIQTKGRVTLPPAVREQLNLKSGDRIMFVETAAGVALKPATVVADEALDEIGEALKAKGLTLEQVLERGRVIRAEITQERYDLADDAA